MDNVINFPTKYTRDWTVIERELDKQLSEHGVSAAAKARIVERMKAFYEVIYGEFQVTFKTMPINLPKETIDAICADIAAQLRPQITEQLQALTYKIFFDRLNREIEGCRDVGLL